MTTFLIMLAVAMVLYWAYTIAVFKLFGIPESYSDTFYKFNEIHKNLGMMFPILLVATTFLVMPGWLVISDTILPNLSFLAFFGGGGLLFVAVAPFFKEYTRDTGRPLIDMLWRHLHGQGLVHMIGALMSMFGVAIWTANSPFWWILVLVLVIGIICAVCTKTYKKPIFWVEFVIFNAIHFSMLTAYLYAIINA